VTPKPTGGHIEREATLTWVPIARMQVNPLAQRSVNWGWVNTLAADFDIEEMGNPTVNARGGLFNIIDGQHRIAALKIWLGDGNWEAQTVECWTYKELTDEQEAEKFLRIQARLKPHAFDEFRVAVKAGRETEAEVNRIVEEAGLVISRARTGVSATGTLSRVYRRGGPEVLARTLLIIKNAYGEAGFEAAVIDGIGLFCQRYSTEITDERVIKRLTTAAGGAGGLLNRASQLRLTTGSLKAQCVAAAVVDMVNRGSGGRKIPSWWRADAEDASEQ
jgi:hypothetical protein